MEICRGYQDLSKNYPKVFLTIGNFDGLHLGHRQIIESIIKNAKKVSGTSVVYTFKPHPHFVLSKEGNIQLINTYDEKLTLLEEMGVDLVIEQVFSREFSTISAEKFLQDVLIKRLSPVGIYVGYDFGFGKDRKGSLDLLKKLTHQEKIELKVFTPLKVDGEICSSSRIRNYIVEGNVEAARRLLGRDFFYQGLVVRGNGRGKKIGFATANVHTENKLRVKEGVYATWAEFKGKRYSSITNVGRQPTFNDDLNAPVVVETHLFDFDQDIYGEIIKVCMVSHIRDEKKFSSIDTLVTQIKKDVISAKNVLTQV